MLAQGGFHPYSRVNVTGVGREYAKVIFYRALTDWLLGNAGLKFYDVRVATLNAAAAT
jgi:Zn-dependent metalloprotease